MFNVAEKVALVTGGAHGIGLAIVRELLHNGVKGVAILDVNEALGQEALQQIRNEFGDGKARFLRVDVSSRQEFGEAFRKAVDIFKQLDIVVNNAGILNDLDWEKEIGVNLIGTTNGTIFAFEDYLPSYRSGEEGVILNISSYSALHCHASAPVYAATKGGVITLTRCLGRSVHYKQKNIRVMALCPASVSTGISSTLISPSYVEIQKNHDFNPRPIPQSPEVLGKAAVQIIQEGENGSVWIAEDNKPAYEIEISFTRKEKNSLVL
uniref:15-hydroxyprostaglandin dehydrogenase n=1 Tax=Photinus pyralis TaxID=7054 RepID=A0A1Y1LXV0_PHOPY